MSQDIPQRTGPDLFYATDNKLCEPVLTGLSVGVFCGSGPLLVNFLDAFSPLGETLAAPFETFGVLTGVEPGCQLFQEYEEMVDDCLQLFRV